MEKENIIEIKGLTAEELYDQIAPLGADLRLARRIQGALFRTGSFPSELPEVSGKLLSKIRERARVSSLELVDRIVSPADGFARYLFKGDGDEIFESVRIPLFHRPGDEKYIICVSSQVGCAMGCSFCETGKLGFIRNLSAWEIVDQVMAIKKDSPHPIGGVVYMGMGEPLNNYENVLRSAKIISAPTGMAISAKAVTISTSGVVPGIIRFTEENLPYRLVLSLSSAESEVREKLMPVEKKWPLPELVDAIRNYHNKTGERVTLAWTMISGVNCQEKDAIALAELFRGIPIKLDLIDVNDPSGRLLPPSDEERNEFLDYLREHVKMPVARRYSGGKDIDAACGMLAGRASKKI